MTKTRVEKYRAQLRALAERVRGTAAGLEEQARAAIGGGADGNLSSAPMHLGDLGTEAYTQELSATLLENEEYIRDESMAALDRIDAGTFGKCEACGVAVVGERLDTLPYTRHCTACAGKLQDGPDVNLNTGRPPGQTQYSINPHADRGGAGRTGDGEEPSLSIDRTRGVPAVDRHAAGDPGGGSAVGGLAGTNIGDGEPDEGMLDEAMANGTFDEDLETDPDDQAYSGPTGGAVGGTPAGKRSAGGKTAK